MFLCYYAHYTFVSLHTFTSHRCFCAITPTTPLLVSLPSNHTAVSLPTCLLHVCRLKQQRILFSADGPDRNVLKFKPPMCFNQDNVDLLLRSIETILTEMEDGSVDTSEENMRRLVFGSANGGKKEVLEKTRKASEASISAGNGGSSDDFEPVLKKLRR